MMLFELPSKTLLIKFFYVISGVLLLLSLIIVFYTYVLRLKVETAVVSARIETMVSPVSGYITDILVATGDSVKQGDRLLQIENLFLARQLELARVQVEESKLSFDYYQQRLENELQRLKMYQKIGHHRLISSQSMVNVSKQDVLTAEQNLVRFSALHAKHYVSNAVFELNQAAYVSAQEKLNHVTAQYNVEKQALNNALKHGMYFSGTKAEGISQDLEAELVAAQKRITLNENRVNVYEHLIEKLTLKAPFDGKVTQIMKSTGNTTDTTQPLILIEKTTENKLIIAYLTQDEIIHIGASKHVKIYLPSSGKIYHGQITEINRTEGFVDEVKAQYRWRDFQIDRSAMVTIAIQQDDRHDFDKQAVSGMPAIVYFSRLGH